MLKSFEVSGFKNFSDKVVINFDDVGAYDFNHQCVKDDLVKTSIIYGKNSVGKSNFGLALFDIVSHLTRNNISKRVYDYYLNSDSSEDLATFKYVFQFDEDVVEYTYSKDGKQQLLFENVILNGKEFYEYDFIKFDGEFKGLIAEDGADRHMINRLLEKSDDVKINRTSKLMNIQFSSMIVERFPELRKILSLIKFVSNMLWFRNLDENRFIGYKSSASDYYDFIFEQDVLKEFQAFLTKAGVQDTLVIKDNADTSKGLYIDGMRPLPFFKVASSGTKSLYNYFYWLKTSTEASIVFIDEFDSYYHFELSETIVQMLSKLKNSQVILTSHNTNLLTNRIMRPDCFFILTNKGITSFKNATNRELREGHNLEKLYMSGEFNG